MKISPSYLAARLSETFKLNILKPLSDLPSLDGAGFITSADIPSGSSVWIPADGSVPYTNLSEGFILSSIDYPETSIRVEDTVSPFRLMDAVIKIFTVLDSWFEDLSRLCLEGGTVQKMLERSESVIHHPMLVISVDYMIIATTASNRVTELPTLKDGFLGTTDESFSDITSLKQDPEFHELEKLDGVFYYPGNLAVDSSVCINLKRDGQMAYRLMYENGPDGLDRRYSFLLETLAPFIMHALSYNLQGERESDKSLHNVIMSFMSSKNADYVSVSNQLDRLGWSPESRYLCLVLKPSSLDVVNMTLRTIAGYMENTIPGAAAIPFHENVVIFINLTDCPYSPDQIEHRLSVFIRDSFLKAGYSRIMEGHFNLRRQYEQAMIAIETGERIRPDRWIFHFNDTALTYILDQAEKRLPGDMICSEGLLRLMAHDRKHGSEYAQTLRTYLNHNQNAVKTAKELYIHRSTFLYRLDKIREILGSQLENPDEILYLMLSYKLLDNEARRKK